MDNLNQFDNFDKYIYKACKENDLSMIVNIVEHYKQNAQDNYLQFNNYLITKGFEFAIYDNCLSIIHYLLTSIDLKKHSNIHYSDDFALRLSCHSGHIELVKFLLTSPLLKEHSNCLANESEPFRWAAEGNHIEVMTFLLNNDFHINPHYVCRKTQNSAFMMACDQNAFEAVKYISKLHYFNLEQSITHVNTDGKDGFQLACENYEKDCDIIEYLILELEFKPNLYQQEYINNNLDNSVVAFANDLLNSKILHDDLNSELNVKNTKYSKIKM